MGGIPSEDHEIHSRGILIRQGDDYCDGRVRFCELVFEAAAAEKASSSSHKIAPTSVPIYKLHIKGFPPMAQLIDDN